MTRKQVHIPVDNTNSADSFGGRSLLNFAHDSYLERTSRPIYAVIFLLPFIVFYEIGTLLINTDVLSNAQVRVVAFVWLQDLLGYLGYAGRLAWIAPPLVVVVILLGLQISSQKPWSVTLKDLGPMAVECTLLAIPLIVLSLFVNSQQVSDPAEVNVACAISAQSSHEVVTSCAATTSATGGPLQAVSGSTEEPSFWASMITGIGAGIYEELVFRLILICLLMMILQDLLGMTRNNSIVLSVLISAALFSAHHHVIFINGEFGQTSPFKWTAFVFRALAGVYFAVLFAIRGFGIAAGTHAFYDIMATGLNASFFES